MRERPGRRDTEGAPTHAVFSDGSRVVAVPGNRRASYMGIGDREGQFIVSATMILRPG